MSRTAAIFLFAAVVVQCLPATRFGPAGCPTAAASPASLSRTIAAFQSSPEANGLRFGAVFLPLTEACRRDSTTTGGPAAPEEGIAQAGLEESTGGVRGTSRDATVSFGSNLPLVPASLAKIPVAILALERLGPGYTFRTAVLADGPLEDGVLHGDLILRGGGDPFLVSERVWLLAHRLRQLGLRRVEGSLVVDESVFVPEAEDSSRVVREFSRQSYGARLAPLAVNFGSASVLLMPGQNLNEAGRVVPDPFPVEGLVVDGRLRTLPPGNSSEWSFDLRGGVPAETATVRGALASDAGPESAYRSVTDPGLYAAGTVESFLRQEGIEVSGRPRRGTAGDDARLLLEHESPPLADLLRGALRHSNNFMTDLITVALSDSMVTGQPGPWGLSRGAGAVTAWIREETGAGTEVVQFDGSGLDPRDQLTADGLVKLLVQGWCRLDIQADFLSCLPAPGESGTLKRRFRDDDDPPTLRAKTGTRGEPPASGLAGYLDDPRLGITAFVLLMNGREGSAWTVSRMQDLQERWIREYVR